MTSIRFPILLEVAGDDPLMEEPTTTQIFRMHYLQGAALGEDRLDMSWEPVFDSGTAEDTEATWTATGRVAFVWSRRGPRRLYVMTPSGKPSQLISRMVRKARFSPKNDEVAFLAPDEPRGSCWDWALWLCRPDGSEIRQLELPELPVQHLEYSPDGQLLWFSLWSYRRPQARGLYCYHRATGTVELEAAGEYQEFSLSPDGRRMVFVGNRGETALCMRDLESGRERVVRWLGQEQQGWGESSLLSPAFSPDGTRILYGVHHQGESWSRSQLCVTLEDGGESRVLWEEEGAVRVVPRLLAA